jgi:hypothetical protein
MTRSGRGSGHFALQFYDHDWYFRFAYQDGERGGVGAACEYLSGGPEEERQYIADAPWKWNMGFDGYDKFLLQAGFEKKQALRDSAGRLLVQRYGRGSVGVVIAVRWERLEESAPTDERRRACMKSIRLELDSAIKS